MDRSTYLYTTLIVLLALTSIRIVLEITIVNCAVFSIVKWYLVSARMDVDGHLDANETMTDLSERTKERLLRRHNKPTPSVLIPSPACVNLGMNTIETYS